MQLVDWLTGPRLLTRLEGAAALVVAVGLYWAIAGSWWVFGLGFLLPDLSLLGFLINRRVGTSLYNIVHTHVAALLLGLFAVVSGSHVAAVTALVWLAHQGFDRLLGLGLKYGGSRKETHLQRL